MDLTNLKNLKNLLNKYQIRPFKKKGQNFLINKKTLDKIIEVIDPQPEDTIIEIGGGLGTLSQAIASKVKKLIVLEIDKKLIEILKENLSSFKNVEILENDFLKIPIKNGQFVFPKIKISQPCKLIGNLPYQITGAIFRKITQKKITPKSIIFLVQKEVADRICSKNKTSVLSLIVQFFGQAKILQKIPPACFYPKPKVNSSLLQIIPKKDTISQEKEEKIIKIAKACFNQKRKKILNPLSSFLNLNKEKTKEILEQIKINPYSRSEDLKKEEWIKFLDMNYEA